MVTNRTYVPLLRSASHILKLLMKRKCIYNNTATFYYSVWFLYSQLIIHSIDFSHRLLGAYGSHNGAACVPGIRQREAPCSISCMFDCILTPLRDVQYAKMSTLFSSPHHIKHRLYAIRRITAAVEQSSHAALHMQGQRNIYVFSCFEVIHQESIHGTCSREGI